MPLCQAWQPPTCGVVRRSCLGLVVVAPVILVDVARAALPQTETVVGGAVAGAVGRLVLELCGAGLACCGGDGNAGVCGGVAPAPSHAPSVLSQSRHSSHSSIEIGVAGRQSWMLRRSKRGS